MSSVIQEVAAFLAETSVCFIATADGDQPRVRAFQYQFEQDGKLWFCTARSKDVFKQLQANPKVELCALKQDMTWLRVTAQVTFEDSHPIKERIIAEQPGIKGIYGTADNPDFTTFCLQHGACIITGFSGNPPWEGSF